MSEYWPLLLSVGVGAFVVGGLASLGLGWVQVRMVEHPEGRAMRAVGWVFETQARIERRLGSKRRERMDRAVRAAVQFEWARDRAAAIAEASEAETVTVLAGMVADWYEEMRALSRELWSAEYHRDREKALEVHERLDESRSRLAARMTEWH